MNAKNTPIDELISEYADECCDFTNMKSVQAIALRYVETMPDSHVRCLLYLLAKQEGHKLVPLEPSEEVRERFLDEWFDEGRCKEGDFNSRFLAAYKAMIGVSDERN